LAHFLQPQDVKQVINLSIDDARLIRYLQGEEINVDVEKGWILVTVDGLSLGWGKASQGRMKNHYPKGLRLTHTHK
jgi:NOL1/NOP2/fmu family ribosome biogenesis protein